MVTCSSDDPGLSLILVPTSRGWAQALACLQSLQCSVQAQGAAVGLALACSGSGSSDQSEIADNQENQESPLVFKWPHTSRHSPGQFICLLSPSAHTNPHLKTQFIIIARHGRTLVLAALLHVEGQTVSAE